MTNKMPCEVIRDLLPSYVDGLTSETTNRMVEQHTAECTGCKQALDSMRRETPPSISGDDEKEIDFLKKTRRRKIGAAVGSALAVAFVLVTALIAKVYFIGSDIAVDYVDFHLSVEGNSLHIDGFATDENLDVPFVRFEETDGVVNISFRSVQKSRFHQNGCWADFESERQITRVCIDDRIVWDNGKAISAITAEAFQTRHPYIGAMPENGETAEALRMSKILGPYKNILQTKEGPYGWTLVLETDISASQQAVKETQMQAYACAFLALIDNLGTVTFEYTVDETAYTLTMTAEEASAFAGRNIKEFGTEVYLFQELMEKTVFAPVEIPGTVFE